MHPVFHVSLLKEYFEDSVRPEREQVLRPVPEVARIPCEGSNMGTQFGLGECQEGSARL